MSGPVAGLSGLIASDLRCIRGDRSLRLAVRLSPEGPGPVVLHRLVAELCRHDGTVLDVLTIAVDEAVLDAADYVLDGRDMRASGAAVVRLTADTEYEFELPVIHGACRAPSGRADDWVPSLVEVAPLEPPGGVSPFSGRAVLWRQDAHDEPVVDAMLHLDISGLVGVSAYEVKTVLVDDERAAIATERQGVPSNDGQVSLKERFELSRAAADAVRGIEVYVSGTARPSVSLGELPLTGMVD